MRISARFALRLLLLLGLMAGLGGLLAGPSAARAESAPGDGPRVEASAHAWRGRYCTPLGCGPAAPASVASVAAFGLAVLAAAWLGRGPR